MTCTSSANAKNERQENSVAGIRSERANDLVEHLTNTHEEKNP